MIVKRAGSRPNTVRIAFQLPSTTVASTIHIVGDFNNWDRRSHPLTRSCEKVPRETIIELERGKAYQLRYLVDGKLWQNDWRADRYVPNPFGGENSVVQT